jgi:hypothetical protein
MKNDESVLFDASWGRLLKGMSLGVVVLFVGLAGAGKAGGAALWLFPLLLMLALPFVVRGYVVTEKELIIQRLGWQTRFSLDDFQTLEIDPGVMKGSIRLCGNGGLFSFTGLYRNKKLGNYRAFVNDWKKTVVLHFGKRTIVVSPDDPASFAKSMVR